MSYQLFIVLISLITISFSSDDHAGHQHTDDTVPDCSCTTGITTAELDCEATDFAEDLEGLQDYLRKNDCSSVCMHGGYMGSSADDFECFQAFSLLVQYHDYCETGTINETLFHEYLEVCPDCNQEHYYVEGAVECDSEINCTNTTDQEANAQFVLDTCETSNQCEDGCVEAWRTVEGYHRMCAHSELSETFDELFDQLNFESAVCANISCNVPWEEDYTPNCSSSANMENSMNLEMYEPLDLEHLLEHDHDHDHDSHQHTDESVPDCSCITGIVTDDLDCDDATDIISDLQEFLEEESCDQYCSNNTYIGTTEETFLCFQAFSLLVQYHDYCETGTVDEELFHEYLEKCPDCKQEHYYVEGAVECDGELMCEDSTAQEAEVQNVIDNCNEAGECADGCVESWRKVEGYHRMCDHHDLSEDFDTLFEQAIFGDTGCTNISCNVPWEDDYMANCSSQANMGYADLLSMYDAIDVDEIHDDGHAGHQHNDDSVADCSCITGITTDELNCDDAANEIDDLQTYLTDNECDKYCHHEMFHGDDDESFECFQVFALVLQYHDYCETGTVDEELIHEYLEVCPDCKQEHYYVEGAVECDGSLNCTDTTAQDTDIEFVFNNCDAAACGDGCIDRWRRVEGYHRMCDHHDLSEEFDKLYDDLLGESACTNISCNVPWEEDYTPNCSSSANSDYTALLTDFGPLDTSDIVTDDTTTIQPDMMSNANHIIVLGVIGLVFILSIIFV